jgi:7-carboxy-7-deazaguanine synthase
MIYPVSTVFRSFQGEGHFVGTQMVFIRLAGCSVTGCSIRKECDEAPWKATKKATEETLTWEATELMPRGIACITGGEPTDHDLIPLVSELRSHGFRVHLETSGVRSVEGMPFDWITVSPKTADYVQRQGHTLKIVLRPGMTHLDVHTMNEGTQFFHRYLQPLTMPDGSTNTAEAIKVLQDLGGDWALSAQAHKLWMVR